MLFKIGARDSLGLAGSLVRKLTRCSSSLHNDVIREPLHYFHFWGDPEQDRVILVRWSRSRKFIFTRHFYKIS